MPLAHKGAAKQTRRQFELPLEPDPGLAAAYAECGRFDEESATARQAAAAAAAQGQQELANRIQWRQALYDTAEPYREARGVK